MADFQHTLGAYMRSYPNIYPEPQDALVAILTEDGIWNEGQWLPNGLLAGTPHMNYADLVDDPYDTASDKLETRAQRFCLRFMDEHMDILAEDPTKTYFRES